MFTKDFSKRSQKNVAFRNTSFVEPTFKPRRERNNEDPNSQITIAELFNDLKTALAEKSKLESENVILKRECSELRKGNTELIKITDENRVKFEEDFHRFKAELEQSEQNITENSKKYLAQQKRYTTELRGLTLEKERMKLDYEEKQKELYKTIKDLESEKEKYKQDYDSMKTTCDEYMSKANRYKSKLKYAVNMINDLNTLLMQYSTKPETNSVQVQTMGDNECEEPSMTTGISVAPYPSENDDILLSEIFFKTKTFCDNELLMFNNDES